MTGTRADGAEAALAALRDRARVTNAHRVEVIEAAFAALERDDLDEAQRAQAVATAHSLAGSAGTFGFAAATRAALAVEELLGDGAVRTPDTAEQGLAVVRELWAALSEPTGTEGRDE